MTVGSSVLFFKKYVRFRPLEKKTVLNYFLGNSWEFTDIEEKKIGYKIGFEWQQRVLSKTISWKFKSFFFKKKRVLGHFSSENLKSARMDGCGGLLGNCLQLYQRGTL